MWIVCITSVRHVLTVNGYGGRQTKENEKSWCFKGWETLVTYNGEKRLFTRMVSGNGKCVLAENVTPFCPSGLLPEGALVVYREMFILRME